MAAKMEAELKVQLAPSDSGEQVSTKSFLTAVIKVPASILRRVHSSVFDNINADAVEETFDQVSMYGCICGCICGCMCGCECSWVQIIIMCVYVHLSAICLFGCVLFFVYGKGLKVKVKVLVS